jgi:hypothetical protein
MVASISAACLWKMPEAATQSSLSLLLCHCGNLLRKAEDELLTFLGQEDLQGQVSISHSWKVINELVNMHRQAAVSPTPHPHDHD